MECDSNGLVISLDLGFNQGSLSKRELEEKIDGKLPRNLADMT